MPGCMSTVQPPLFFSRTWTRGRGVMYVWVIFCFFCLFCYLRGFSFPQAGLFSCRMRLSRTSSSAWLPRPERDGIAEFKTKCVGYPDAENTWEPYTNLARFASGGKALFQEFFRGVDDDRLRRLLPRAYSGRANDGEGDWLGWLLFSFN